MPLTPVHHLDHAREPLDGGDRGEGPNDGDQMRDADIGECLQLRGEFLVRAGDRFSVVPFARFGEADEDPGRQFERCRIAPDGITRLAHLAPHLGDARRIGVPDGVVCIDIFCREASACSAFRADQERRAFRRRAARPQHTGLLLAF